MDMKQILDVFNRNTSTPVKVTSDMKKYISIIREGNNDTPQSSAETIPTSDPTDVVTVDIPLLIRLLEYAREDAKTDMDLHNVTERLISFSKEKRTLTMTDYESIIQTDESSAYSESLSLLDYINQLK